MKSCNFKMLPNRFYNFLTLYQQTLWKNIVDPYDIMREMIEDV